MGSWYWIGVAAGVGTGVGVAIGALIPEGRPGVRVSIAAIFAVAAGIGIGLLVGGWAEAAAGAIGGLLGALASVPVVAGALRRGGTRSGLAVLVAMAGAIVAGIAIAPHSIATVMIVLDDVMTALLAMSETSGRRRLQLSSRRPAIKDFSTSTLANRHKDASQLCAELHREIASPIASLMHVARRATLAEGNAIRYVLNCYVLRSV